MKTMLLRGVPLAMQRDGWWLNAPPPPPPPVRGDARGQGRLGPDGLRIGGLAALVALGDVMIWQVVPGLSLAVFAAALVLGALLAAGRRLSGQQQALVAGLTILVLLPLVELVQPLSLLIGVAGVSCILAFIAGVRLPVLWRGALRLWPVGAAQLTRDLRAAGMHVHRPGALRKALFAWGMPLALGFGFALLLSAANPLAERWLSALEPVHWDGARMLFWVVLAAAIWPALRLAAMRERLRAAPGAAPVPFGPPAQGLINAGSVLRAMVLFNLMFAVQTATDVLYLYGGVGLPDGMTYAQYAHRGAYPLLLTALLAGVFALVTRRWTDGVPLMRALLMLWVAQNVALVVSSLVRLSLYVETYGLTRLRLSAAIWMGLVAAGLLLVIWQVWRRRDTPWLARRVGLLGAAVLYLCSFVSFDATIARYNLSHDVQPDRAYLCGLGASALPHIRKAERARGHPLCPGSAVQLRVPRDWREWGFRNARLRNSLRSSQTEARGR